MSEVRVLTESDIPAGMRLKDAAGWNQTAMDWRNLLTLAPEACFGIDGDGELRATTTAVCFGQELAWIGMVLTDPGYRGRGFARRLVEHALGYLCGKGVGWIKLDATDMGRPLYTRLGFREECGIERWIRPAGRVPASGASPGPFALDAALDREAFGADRSRLLDVLARIESASMPGMGFAMGRPGSKAAYFGPCVARSADAARELLVWFLRRHPEEKVCWDILAPNADAITIAREFGFARARSLVRMDLSGVKNVRFEKHDDFVFAAAGFEFG